MQYNRLELVNEILGKTPPKQYENICLMLATFTDKQLREYYICTK